MLHEFITDEEYADHVTAIVYSAYDDPWFDISGPQHIDRFNYSGIAGIPSVRADGVEGMYLLEESDLTDPYYIRYDIDSPIEINVMSTVIDDHVDVTLMVTSGDAAIAGNYKLRCGLISLFYDNFHGNAGQEEWHYNMLEMVPDANGTDFNIEANSTETFNLEFPWPYTLQTDELEQDNVKVIAWVQNDDDREVLNSEWALVGTGTATGVSAIPQVVSLAQNHPNPFNPATTIAFNLQEAQTVSLTVYSVDGRLVTTLVHEAMPAGQHEAIWTGRDDSGRRVATGTYLYRLQAGAFSETKRMLLLK